MSLFWEGMGFNCLLVTQIVNWNFVINGNLIPCIGRAKKILSINNLSVV